MTHISRRTTLSNRCMKDLSTKVWILTNLPLSTFLFHHNYGGRWAAHCCWCNYFYSNSRLVVDRTHLYDTISNLFSQNIHGIVLFQIGRCNESTQSNTAKGTRPILPSLPNHEKSDTANRYRTKNCLPRYPRDGYESNDEGRSIHSDNRRRPPTTQKILYFPAADESMATNATVTDSTMTDSTVTDSASTDVTAFFRIQTFLLK